MAFTHSGSIDKVLPANEAQVNRLRDAIKNMSPNEPIEIDVEGLMDLIRRIDLGHKKTGDKKSLQQSRRLFLLATH